MSIIENYKTILLANGLVSIPEDWIVVSNPFGLDSEATDLAVVESLNWEKYKVPHFAVLVNAVRLTVENCDKIIEACCEVYPALTDIVEMQIDPPMTTPDSDPYYWEKVELYQASPYLGVFRVAATDDDFYDPDHHYPFNVIVFRNNKAIYDVEG